ncbi:TPA: glycosyltransferase family 2 protein [Streptococcus suis]|nr:glycosyltransferase family 2 protein [Streptococcus suis]
MDDLISVIVPVYNVEKYLSQCLESIINQTYKNIEILLINDASTDNSKQICQHYSQLDSRIKLFNKPENRGVSDSRNWGIENCVGEYIIFIDSDDYIEYNFIEKLYEVSISEYADIVVGEYYRYIENQGNFLIHVHNIIKEELSKHDCIDKIFLAHTDIFNFPVAKLIKKNLFFNDFKVSFPTDIRVCEDQFVIYQLYLKSKKTMYYSLAGYCYRTRTDGNLTSTLSDPESIEDIVESYLTQVFDLFLHGYPLENSFPYYSYRTSRYLAILEERGKTNTEISNRLLKFAYLIENGKQYET